MYKYEDPLYQNRSCELEKMFFFRDKAVECCEVQGGGRCRSEEWSGRKREAAEKRGGQGMGEGESCLSLCWSRVCASRFTSPMSIMSTKPVPSEPSTENQLQSALDGLGAKTMHNNKLHQANSILLMAAYPSVRELDGVCLPSQLHMRFKLVGAPFVLPYLTNRHSSRTRACTLPSCHHSTSHTDYFLQLEMEHF
jgi:hypothetical protein